MEIKGIADMYKVNSFAPQSSKINAAKTSEEVSSENKVADRIDISQNAAFRSKLDSARKAFVTEQNQQTLSTERLNALKAQYSGDSCPATSKNIASAMIKTILGI